MIVFFIGLFSKEKQVRDDYEPKISIIIAALNEEKHICKKLENTLALDYRVDRREIIVGSDGSTDATVAIARELSDKGVAVWDFEKNRGKTAVQNDCVRRATGDFFVFMDAASMCNREALKNLVRHFADPKVGCVAGRVEFVDRAKNLVGASQGIYWKYEQVLKRMESRIGSLVGVDGPLYAVRRDAYTELSEDMQSDLITPLLIREMRFDVVLEPKAVASEDTTTASSGEFATRRRVIARGMVVLSRVVRLLNPAKHGFFSFQILSHKLLRWCVGLFAVIMLASSIALSSKLTYALIAWAQILFYGLAGIGFATARSRFRPALLIVPYYFVLVNAAALAGVLSFVWGRRIVTWKPVR